MQTPRIPLLLAGLLFSGCAVQSVYVVSGPPLPPEGQALQPVDLDVCTFWGKRWINTDSWLADKFAERQDPFFRSVSGVPDLQDARDCDLAVKLIIAAVHSAEVFSTRSGESWLKLEMKSSAGAAFAAAIVSQGAQNYDPSVPTRFGAAIFRAFQRGTDLAEKAAAERQQRLRRKKEEETAKALSSGGLSAAELKKVLRELKGGGEDAEAPKAPSVRSDVDSPAYRLPERPDDFAVVVGVEKYSALPDAPFAERDAEAVRRHLVAQGLPMRNIVVLTGSKATRTGIQKYMEEWLPRNVKEDSRVFFYFSGHGAPDVESKQAFLVPWDGDPNFLQSTAYPVRRLYEDLAKLKSKQVVVAMDSCFSGSGGRSVLAKGARPLVMKVDAGAPPENITVFSAAADTQITSAIEEQGHGIFTYYFLKGLAGAAKDSDGRVTAKGLYEYVRPKVEDEARRQNREQSPELRAEKIDIVVSRF